MKNQIYLAFLTVILIGGCQVDPKPWSGFGEQFAWLCSSRNDVIPATNIANNPNCQRLLEGDIAKPKDPSIQHLGGPQQVTVHKQDGKTISGWMFLIPFDI